jgi:hypothetical protein
MTVLDNRLRKRLITRYGGVLELPAAARLVAVCPVSAYETASGY